MAQFTVNTQRFDPYRNFKFRVKWDGRYVAGISRVGGLKKTTEVIKHREGGDPSSSRKSGELCDNGKHDKGSYGALRSDDSLGEHGIGHLEEAPDVGTFDIIDISIIFLAVLLAGLMDIFHDGMESCIHFFTGPGQAHGILGHFES